MTDVSDIRKVLVGLWFVLWGWALYPVMFLMNLERLAMDSEQAVGILGHVASVVYVATFIALVIGGVLLTMVRVGGLYRQSMVVAVVLFALRLTRFLAEGFSFYTREIAPYERPHYGAYIGMTDLLAVIGIVVISVGVWSLCGEIRLRASEKRWLDLRAMLISGMLIPMAVCEIIIGMPLVINPMARGSLLDYHFLLIVFCLSYIPMILFYLAMYQLGREARAAIVREHESELAAG